MEKKEQKETREKKSLGQFLKDLVSIYLNCAKVGLFTIGGGMAMLPMMQREFVEDKKWMTEEELIDFFAIGQSTPGIIAVNVSTFVGYKRCGIIGGFCGTLGMVTPSLIIITLLATLINSIEDYPVVQKALKGVNVVVAALLTNVTYNFAKKTVKNWWSAVVLIASFCALFVFKVQSYWVILSAITIGIAVTLIQTVRARKAKASASVETSENGTENESEKEDK
ncbi:MAG: chromate transporter [Treponema sp.]|nr:chromate transporter [Treponema sp.]